MDRLSLAGTELQYLHVCAFFNSRDEEYDVLLPFFKEALAQGEKNIHIVNPDNTEDHRRRLGEAGMDTPHCEACGQLEVLHWKQTYLDESGSFNKDRMLATVDYLTGAGRDPAFSRVRIMGDMDWVFAGTPGAADILEYEAEVNEVLERNKQPAVCVYDIAKLSGAMMMDVLRTHPLTLIDGVVQENPFFTPPQDMLKELRARKRA
ncbi:MEDS domain-containing protein [Telluria beijingensis]|uniref:MEDS domain-containing protein n=1 Tax=Telluria beijingensis TaxID=3068633 RepID=UPI0027955B6B|nr:MEDS domain-containing protein [Massilia sp. REN29]